MQIVQCKNLNPDILFDIFHKNSDNKIIVDALSRYDPMPESFFTQLLTLSDEHFKIATKAFYHCENNWIKILAQIKEPEKIMAIASHAEGKLLNAVINHESFSLEIAETTINTHDSYDYEP